MEWISQIGRSNLRTTRLGLGAGQIGDAGMDDAEAGRLLNSALDRGIGLVDTACGYGLSEERIGRHLAHRRDEFVLCTKVGYGVPGMPDWTPQTVAAGIDAALRRLRCDHIDIVLLHSCPLDVLKSDGLIEALVHARQAGKIGLAGYSGENDELAWAARHLELDALECSVNLFDQRALNNVLPEACARGRGVIAKRPLGNAPWRFAQRPAGDYAETYWLRMQALGLEHDDLPWDEFALRFAVWAPGVSCAIVGTRSMTHLQHNLDLAERGPLPPALVEATRARFAAVGSDWPGEI